MIEYINNHNEVDGLNDGEKAIIFDWYDRGLIEQVFSRALNTWSNPPKELVKVLDELRGMK